MLLINQLPTSPLQPSIACHGIESPRVVLSLARKLDALSSILGLARIVPSSGRLIPTEPEPCSVGMYILFPFCLPIQNAPSGSSTMSSSPWISATMYGVFGFLPTNHVSKETCQECIVSCLMRTDRYWIVQGFTTTCNAIGCEISVCVTVPALGFMM